MRRFALLLLLALPLLSGSCVAAEPEKPRFQVKGNFLISFTAFYGSGGGLEDLKFRVIKGKPIVTGATLKDVVLTVVPQKGKPNTILEGVIRPDQFKLPETGVDEGQVRR